MPSASFTFHAPEDGSPQDDLFIEPRYTSRGRAAGTRVKGNGALALAHCATFQKNYADALLNAQNRFPFDDARYLSSALTWSPELENALAAGSNLLYFYGFYECAKVLAEMTPVKDSWLDLISPITRIVTERSGVTRHPRMNLAILYQTEPSNLFRTIAHTIARQLGGAGAHLAPDIHPGDRLADENLRGEELTTIFLRHRAVLFLGNLVPAVPKQHFGGWKLTEKDNDTLFIKNIVDLMTNRPQGLHVPELIVAACCSSAAGADLNTKDYFYPERFIKSGVRSFVGSWMKIFIPEKPDDVLPTLMSDFLSNWAEDPENAAQALFEAKTGCPKPLLASLFQLFEALESPSENPGQHEVQTPAPPPPPAEFVIGQNLSEYMLQRKLWDDPWGVGFFATRDGKSFLVQVLSDALQSEERPRIDQAIQRLRKAHLSDKHLIPTRWEMIRRLEGGPPLLALIYDPLPTDDQDSYLRLSESPGAAINPANFYDRLLTLGGSISSRLAELHARGIAHQNFDSSAVVLIDGEVYLKDAWVGWLLSGRCTHPRFVAPEARNSVGLSTQFAADCFGLGVVLFELAMGRPLQPGETSLRAAGNENAAFIPEALDRIVRACLAPKPDLRPTADIITRRLALAANAGGTYLSDLGAEFDERVDAGHRLFCARVTRLEELLRVLHALRGSLVARRDFRVLTVEDNGIVDARNHQTQFAWDGPREEQLDRLMEWIANLGPLSERDMPIVVFRGTTWQLDDGSEVDLLEYPAFARVLKRAQRQRHFPVVIFADSFTQISDNIDSTLPLLFIDFPNPTQSEIFERILAAPESFPPSPLLLPEEAADIATRVFPCSSLELENAFRLCFARYRKIDAHLADFVDDRRAVHTRALGTLSYTPHSRLPDFDHFGWMPSVRAELQTWAASFRATSIASRALLLTADGGYGKSQAPRHIAQLFGLPYFRLDALACLQSFLGQSEAHLIQSLHWISSIGGAVLHIDDLHRFLPPRHVHDDSPQFDSTLERMSTILSRWIDTRPPQVVLIGTAAKTENFTAQWLRRFPWVIALDNPTFSGNSEAGSLFRKSALRALFLSFQLPGPAANESLLDSLAENISSAESFLSPYAVAFPATLSGLKLKLSTPADLAHWMSDTISLYKDLGHTPDSLSLWESALQTA